MNNKRKTKYEIQQTTSTELRAPELGQIQTKDGGIKIVY